MPRPITARIDLPIAPNLTTPVFACPRANAAGTRGACESPRTTSYVVGCKSLAAMADARTRAFSRNAHCALSNYYLVAARRVEGALSHGRTAPALYTRRFFYGLSSRQQKRGPRRRQGSAPTAVFATDGGSGRAADSKKCRLGRRPRLRARTARRSARGDPRTATRAGGQRLGGRRCR